MAARRRSALVLGRERRDQLRPLLRAFGRDHVAAVHVVYVPVEGLPESALGLVWHGDRATSRTKAFAEGVTDALDEPAAG